MSDRFDALALPPRDPYPYPPYGYGYAPPPHEPPVLWRLTKRFWKPLLACAIVSSGIAYLAGRYLTKPLWQAEATLLYQQVALSEKQKAAYEHPPSLPTLAQGTRPAPPDHRRIPARRYPRRPRGQVHQSRATGFDGNDFHCVQMAQSGRGGSCLEPIVGAFHRLRRDRAQGSGPAAD
jgi:hypothetical protein